WQERRQWCREKWRGGIEVASVAEEGAAEEEVATAATVEEGRCRHCKGGRLWLRGKMAVAVLR
ncbi:hypothetical protein GW17_00053381, partial [Ensete ventricosum]